MAAPRDKQPVILNVDDYAPGRYTRTRILRQAGFQVQEAATGQECLSMITKRPDLVLLDINLPDINGIEVCRRIKQNPETAGTVVLHMTASNVLPKDQAAGLNSGADGYLTEPVESTVLVATVKALLRVRQAEDALRRSNDTLRSLTDMMSHELREPIRHISIYGDLLNQNLKDRIQPQEQEFLNHVISGARRLNTLIEAVVVYSSAIDESRTPSNVSAQETLNASLAELELLIDETRARIISENPLPMVSAHKLSLLRIFTNLISNGIKYRSERPPEIRISATTTGEFVRFCVEDNGIGIDPQYHASIFDLFKRLHGPERAGSGIGLSLCRRIAEEMGGSIWVESEVGKGARFYFTVLTASEAVHRGGASA